MASLGDVLTRVRENVTLALYSITPGLRADVTFTSQPEIGDRLGDYHDVTGVPRRFAILWSPAKRITYGHTVVDWMVTGTIVVGYPLHGWDTEQADDADTITRKLNGATGGMMTDADVAYRLIDHEKEPTIESTEDWSWLALPLVVNCQTS